MRNGLLIVAGMAALLGLAGSGQAQAIPDAPQPQKKAAAKPEVPPVSPQPAPEKDDNAFPEAVSRDAAKAAEAQDDPKPSTSDANPFPEAVSRGAAKAPAQESAPTPEKPALPPGVSSSQSQDAPDEAPVIDPARSKKDTEVGGYYLKTQDYQGALLRFQEATATDPTNVDAIFGLAEAQRSLGKKAEAAREYQLYLAIVPTGPKAKEAMKALKSLPPN